MVRHFTRTPRMLRTILAASLMAALSPFALAEISQTTLEEAEALIKSGKADAAYKMLEPLEVEGAGDMVYDYLLGTAALESNRPSKATFIYERILAASPEYVGVRADMGRAYYALGDFGRAKIEFETVLSFQNLPPDLRGAVEQYVKAAEASSQSKKTFGNGYIELGWGSDDNIGSSTSLLTVLLPFVTPAYAYVTEVDSAGDRNPEGTKTPDSYSALSLGGELNHQLSDRWTLFAGGDARARGYTTYKVANNYTADVRTGVSYSGGPWQLRLGVNGGQMVKDAVALRDTVGFSLDWRLASGGSNQYSLGLATTRANYLQAASTVQNNVTTSVTGGWLTSLGDGSAVLSLTLTGGLEADTNDRVEGQRTFVGPRMYVQKSFGESLGGFVSVGATGSVYARDNALYLTQRKENLYDVALGVTWNLRKGIALRPQLVYIRNDSNAELYTYTKTEASLNLRLDF